MRHAVGLFLLQLLFFRGICIRDLLEDASQAQTFRQSLVLHADEHGRNQDDHVTEEAEEEDKDKEKSESKSDKSEDKEEGDKEGKEEKDEKEKSDSKSDKSEDKEEGDKQGKEEKDEKEKSDSKSDKSEDKEEGDKEGKEDKEEKEKSDSSSDKSEDKEEGDKEGKEDKEEKEDKEDKEDKEETEKSEDKSENSEKSDDKEAESKGEDEIDRDGDVYAKTAADQKEVTGAIDAFGSATKKAQQKAKHVDDKFAKYNGRITDLKDQLDKLSATARRYHMQTMRWFKDAEQEKYSPIANMPLDTFKISHLKDDFPLESATVS